MLDPGETYSDDLQAALKFITDGNCSEALDPGKLRTLRREVEDILYDAGIFNPLISTEAAVDNALAGGSGSATSDGAQPETETGNSSSAVDGPIACVEVIISGMKLKEELETDEATLKQLYENFDQALRELQYYSDANPAGEDDAYHSARGRGEWRNNEELGGLYLWSWEIDVIGRDLDRVQGVPWGTLIIGAVLFGAGLAFCKLLDRMRGRRALASRAAAAGAEGIEPAEIKFNHKAIFLGAASAYDMATDATFLFLDLRQNLTDELKVWYNIGIAFFFINLVVNSGILVAFITMEMRRSRKVVAWARANSTVTALALALSATSLECMRLLSSNVLPVLNIPWEESAEARLEAMGLATNLLEDIPQLVVLIKANSILGGYSSTSSASLVATMLLLVYGLSKRMVALLLSTVGEARERRASTVVAPPPGFRHDVLSSEGDSRALECVRPSDIDTCDPPLGNGFEADLFRKQTTWDPNPLSGDKVSHADEDDGKKLGPLETATNPAFETSAQRDFRKKTMWGDDNPLIEDMSDSSALPGPSSLFMAVGEQINSSRNSVTGLYETSNPAFDG